MKYIIAPATTLAETGITPATPTVTDGMVVVNENELRYIFPSLSLAALAAMVDGTVVSHDAAVDFVKGRKSLSQIRKTVTI